MKFQGALITEQGVTFAIVVVKQHVLQSPERDEIAVSFSHHFPFDTPVILMAQNSSGRPTYYGRPDIVKFLAKIDFRRIPWREYTV